MIGGRIRGLAGTLAVGAVVAAVLAGASGGAPPLRGVNFISVCGYSHRGTDDPIVLPRQPGFSHDHTFIGNTSTDAFSTPAKLRAADTTCRRSGDHAAYWTPTLFVGGNAVVPSRVVVYYRRNTTKPVKAFPAGLQMVAGNSKATAPQRLNVTWWDCGDVQTTVPHTATVPQCPDGGLSLHVNFPDCWDGKSLAYANQRNMAYSVNGRCTKTHPVPTPAISLTVTYPVNTTTQSVELASGGQYSGHADFINAWDQSELARLTAKCLNAYRHCGLGG
jgi:Domain of unknown function (DUF1996)